MTEVYILILIQHEAEAWDGYFSENIFSPFSIAQNNKLYHLPIKVGRSSFYIHHY